MVSSPAKQRHSLPRFNQPAPIAALAAGLDVGNTATKLALPETQIRIPSYIQPVDSRQLHQLPASGYVRYSAGNDANLHGTAWLTGKAAYQYNPEGYLRIVDDRSAKITQGLQLLLGALSYLPYQPVWQLSIVASIHHARDMGAALKQALEGTHTLYFNDQPEPSHVSITCRKVLDEGAGAVAGANLTSGQNLVYDFGGGTTIISVFGEKGRLVHRQVSPGGVQALIDAMAKNSAVIRKLAGEADRETIRRSLEDGRLRYGRQNAWDMRPIYESELKSWIRTVLRTALKAGEKWQSNCDRVVAIGGGVQLPLVADLLRKRGIVPLEGSCWANAKGLQQIATLLGGHS